MAPSTAPKLEREDHGRDAAFNKAMHGKSSQARAGFAAMLSKGAEAKKAAVDEYFKHWDNKPAADETPEQRAVRSIEGKSPPKEPADADGALVTGSHYRVRNSD